MKKEKNANFFNGHIFRVGCIDRDPEFFGGQNEYRMSVIFDRVHIHGYRKYLKLKECVHCKVASNCAKS